MNKLTLIDDHGTSGARPKVRSNKLTHTERKKRLIAQSIIHEKPAWRLELEAGRARPKM